MAYKEIKLVIKNLIIYIHSKVFFLFSITKFTCAHNRDSMLYDTITVRFTSKAFMKCKIKEIFIML